MRSAVLSQWRQGTVGSCMAGFTSFDNGTCERFLDLLEASYLRLRKENYSNQCGVSDGGGNGGGCFGIEVRTDTA